MLVSVATDVLNQLKKVLIQLSSTEYAAQLNVFNGASIGKHSRHIIEFFQCLMKSTTGSVLNYDARTRYIRLEEDVQYSIEALEKITEYISENSFENMHISLITEFGGVAPLTVSTNFNRELIYLIEHSVHHFALMRIGIQENFPHVILCNGFGVAYATIKFQNNA